MFFVIAQKKISIFYDIYLLVSIVIELASKFHKIYILILPMNH